MNLCSSCGCDTSKGSPATPSQSMQLAIATVPMQPWEQPYDFQTALNHGTIFPCLDLPFFAAGGVKQ